MLLNIILLNFIIAVISQSYEKVMAKIKALNYKIKAEMIYEREIHFNLNDLQNRKYFPKFLILRRPTEED